MARSPKETAARFLPRRRTKSALQEAAARCTACDLYRRATRTVFGEGPLKAELMLVGEQPGDREDLEGAPFVGPAGGVLDRALAELGLDRGTVWVTNAVKHFKWKARGKTRLHQKPDVNEVEICNPWLVSEVLLVKPACVVAMGTTAVRAVLGRSATITRSRRRILESRMGPAAVVTYHPSAILRAPEHEDRAALFALFVDDLRLAREVAAGRVRPELR